jgi:hypothetical protein
MSNSLGALKKEKTMSGARIITAGIVGGVVMFIWGAIDHRALPLGEMGIKSLPGEAVVLPAMKTSIHQRGLYFFPGRDMKDKSPAAEKAWEEKFKAGPQGILVYDPAGSEPMSPGMLGRELLSNVLAAVLLAVVLSAIKANKFAGTVVGAGMGLFAWLSISVSYWNWYHFPPEYTMAEMVEQGVGGALTGLAIAIVYGVGRGAKPQPM